jgi:hypothetical protein
LGILRHIRDANLSEAYTLKFALSNVRTWKGLKWQAGGHDVSGALYFTYLGYKRKQPKLNGNYELIDMVGQYNALKGAAHLDKAAANAKARLDAATAPVPAVNPAMDDCGITSGNVVTDPAVKWQWMGLKGY